MRISDWSSDVCSSDLPAEPADPDDAADRGSQDLQHQLLQPGKWWPRIHVGADRPGTARADRIPEDSVRSTRDGSCSRRQTLQDGFARTASAATASLCSTAPSWPTVSQTRQ